MEIPINPNLDPTLVRLATDNGTTPAQYAAGVLEGHLLAAMKLKTVREIEQLPVADVKQVADDIAELYESKQPAPKTDPVDPHKL